MSAVCGAFTCYWSRRGAPVAVALNLGSLGALPITILSIRASEHLEPGDPLSLLCYKATIARLRCPVELPQRKFIEGNDEVVLMNTYPLISALRLAYYMK